MTAVTLTNEEHKVHKMKKDEIRKPYKSTFTDINIYVNKYYILGFSIITKYILFLQIANLFNFQFLP